MSAAPCPRCASPVPPGVALCPRCLLAEDATSRMGHLELEDCIGKGGMGEVYRARDLRLGRPVAVKFLPEALAATPEGRARFEREARALALLNHPNIVTLYEFGELEGQPYLAMELVEGASLPTRLPLPRAEAIGIALQVCAALGYAHQRGIVHRDIKPANVLVGADGRVKVADFGIARMVRGDGPSAGWTLTQANAVAGTPQYLAPEVLQGAPLDPRMDVFSVGVLVYELLTGKLPVGEFPPLEPGLDAVVRRALSSEPQRRYPSMEALAEALRPYAAETATDELPRDEQVWVRAVALIQAVAAALVFFAGLSMFSPRISAPGELLPLVAVAPEYLPDGRVVTRARFELWPTLIAAIGISAAIAAYGLLLRHWRRHGLDRREPHARIQGSKWMLAAGVVACLLYALRKWLEVTGRVGPTTYLPVLGGVFELWVVYFAFLTLLDAARRGRPPFREPLLWLGCALAVVPPVIEFFAYLERWKP